MQIYSKSHKKCFISQPILIWFALSHRANLGLQILYTEFQNSLIMQIYATNLGKFRQNHTKNASSSFVNWFLFGLLYLVELSLVRQTSTQNLEILLHMLIIVIYAN